jgi:hypothetical protein
VRLSALLNIDDVPDYLVGQSIDGCLRPRHSQSLPHEISRAIWLERVDEAVSSALDPETLANTRSAGTSVR